MGLSRFAEKTIRNAAGCRGLWGFTWWCSHDFYGRYAELSREERALGLLDTRNRPKPAGKRIAALIEEFSQSPPSVVVRPLGLVLPDDLIPDGAEPGADHALRQFIAHYVELCDRGTPPAIVLQSKAGDPGHLAQRGISQLVAGEYFPRQKSIWTKKWFE